jgi:hypothetical protein
MTRHTLPVDALSLSRVTDASQPLADGTAQSLALDGTLPVLQVVQASGALRILAVLSTFLLSAVLGLVIARKAYQGYATTRSKPMLYLAVGIVLLTAVPALLSTVLTNLTALPGYQVVLVTNGAEILGLLSVAYSLYGDF